ncbi:hypothetical protein TOPH_03762 [Tolypocladium ophioglossoides CBS 100239]|uniref:Vps72/YL1 C-terminal domain-containing protein n=1 Tax=Tolypocladium ophioglossoides (strain CBS 100239) TaxID=1163406 RepID=A0A0L0NCE4_TOLOC|nr:hypothetical protein TOPH_03762 [Tolypocladium ophioglossoides CBS 100239]
MDSESKTSDRDGSRLSDPPTDSDSDGDGNSDSSDSDTEAQRTEWLATTRQRRSTAGNRMKSMLANGEPDSDLELLFAEDDDDQGFSDVEGDASDVQMDSSSDNDDDDNNAANDDDLEGEKELERQAKERHAAQRKRKAQEAIPAKFRKRVRIDLTTPAAPAPAPAPRPKKKSERASWLPSPADLPTRASSRQTTRTSKEQLHQQMVEREARRLKQLAQMQKKAAKLEAMKKPPMTQAERLAEAAIVEKRNSKSLNRWEEAEKQREEERRAKLAALNNRTLKGPVITFWSGVREWKDALGQHVTMVEEKPKKKREKADKGAKCKGKDGDKTATPEMAEKKTDVKATAAGDATPAPKADPESKPTEGAPAAEPTTTTATNGSSNDGQRDALKEQPTATFANSETQQPASQPPAPVPKQEETPRLMAMPPLPPPPSPAPPSGLAAPAPPPQSPGRLATPSGMSRPPESRPSGVLAAPVLAPPPGINVNGTPPTNGPKSNVLAPPNTSQQSAPPPMQRQSPRPERPAAAAVSAAPEPKPTVARETHLQPPQNEATPVSKSASPGPSEPPQAPAGPVHNSTTARNAIIYRSFDENAIRDKTVQTQILFGRKMTKLPKPTPAPLCVITNHPARYRDSKTGLSYYNATAYREIQRLHRGDYRWSRLIGAWVGSGTLAARGVPERFLHPEPEEERKKRLEERKKKAEEAKAKAEEEKKQAEEKKVEEARATAQEEKKPPVADATPAAGLGDGSKAREEATAAQPAPPGQQATVVTAQ